MNRVSQERAPYSLVERAGNRFSPRRRTLAVFEPRYMDEPKYSVKVLEKVVKILNLYTYNEGSFTLDQIAKKAALSKTTAFRILENPRETRDLQI